MSTNDPSVFEVNVAQVMQMKEQIVKMIRMMQQLVVEGNRESSSPTLEGFAPHFENENRPPLDLNQGQTTPPFTPQGNYREVDHPKDKTSDSVWGINPLMKNCFNLLVEKRGSVTLQGCLFLISIPFSALAKVIMPELFKEFEDNDPDLACIIWLYPEEFSVNAITSSEDDLTSTI